jgi:16S rRNA U516 pseudouridylate synthase RsuA-like enzyme
MIETIGLEVKNLKRIRINKLLLPNIPPGQFTTIKKEDIL